MTLANRMGRTANHVSRLAFGVCAALAASAVLAAFPGAAHAEQAAPAPLSPPPTWPIRTASCVC